MVEMANEDCTPSDSLATASTESQELFNNGKVAMQLNWSISILQLLRHLEQIRWDVHQ